MQIDSTIASIIISVIGGIFAIGGSLIVNNSKASNQRADELEKKLNDCQEAAKQDIDNLKQQVKESTNTIIKLQQQLLDVLIEKKLDERL